MIHPSLLQIQSMGVLDPIAILFLVGATAWLYGAWYVIRNPFSVKHEEPLEMDQPQRLGHIDPAL